MTMCLCVCRISFSHCQFIGGVGLYHRCSTWCTDDYAAPPPYIANISVSGAQARLFPFSGYFEITANQTQRTMDKGHRNKGQHPTGDGISSEWLEFAGMAQFTSSFAQKQRHAHTDVSSLYSEEGSDSYDNLMDEGDDHYQGVTSDSVDGGYLVDDPARLDIKHFSDESVETRKSKSPSTMQTEPREPTTPTDDYEDITISRAMGTRPFQPNSLPSQPQQSRRLPNTLHGAYMDASVAFWPEGSQSTMPLYDTQLLPSQLHPEDTLQTGVGNISIPVITEQGDDPMKYLLVEEKSLNMRLNDLMMKHSRASKKGVSTRLIRDNISRCFRSLSMVYQAVTELYDAQKNQKTTILDSFKEWEAAKKTLNANIEDIQSTNNEEGLRLRHLEQQSRDIDNEVDKLEMRLQQLKAKKKVLSTEITRSQSVIESRTSSHLESLKQIETAEKSVVTKLFANGGAFVAQQMAINEQRPASMLGSFLTRFAPQSYPQVSNYDPDQVIDIIERQLQLLTDGVDNYSTKEKVYEESLVIWENISEVLLNLEHDLKVALKSQTSDSTESTKMKLQSYITKTLELLQSRMDSIKDMNDILKNLFQTEISILQTGLQMIDPKLKFKPIHEVSSPQPPLITKPAMRKPSIAEPTLSTSPPERAVNAGVGPFIPSTSLGNRLKDTLTGKKPRSISDIGKNEKRID